MQYCAGQEPDSHNRQRNGDLHSSLVRPIGMRAVQQHTKYGYRANASKNHAYSQIADSKERLNNQGRPKGITIESRGNEKKITPSNHTVSLVYSFKINSDTSHSRWSALSQEASSRRISKIEGRYDAQNYRGKTFDQEQPLLSFQSPITIETK